MKLRETTECPNCKQLARRVAKLEKQLAAARKDSSTSCKPPSSDIVKPKKPRGKGGKKRKRGGQPGHERHERPSFPAGMIDDILPYSLDACPDCGGELLFSRQAEPRVIQQAELVAKPLWITEHRASAYWCPHCRKVHYAPLPAAVEKTGLFGPELTTLVAFMKGVCHASFSTIRKFLRDVVGVKISRGYLAKLIAKVSRWLSPAYDELLARLPSEAYFQFITTPGVEPTNNLAEQAIRFVVIDRRITQGTRSETGRRWCERIWTTIATCAQQGRSVFAFLLESIQSHLRGTPPPSLMPSGP